MFSEILLEVTGLQNIRQGRVLWQKSGCNLVAKIVLNDFKIMLFNLEWNMLCYAVSK